jgi:hypothetical protein
LSEALTRRALVLLAIALGLALSPSASRAHGREPSVGEIAFDPSDPEHLVARATWAFLTTRDRGDTFTWTCALAVGYDRTIEDPPVVISASGRLLAGTFDGIALSDPSGCSYGLVTDEDIADLLIIDLALDPFDPHVVWAATSPGDHPNTIARSPDEGETWEALASFETGILLERLVLSPSDPMRMYASGVALRTATDPRRAYVFRSIDGGHTFDRTEIPLVDVDRTDYGERNVHVLGVDPTDPDVVFARVTRRPTDMMPERLLRSDDGGLTFDVVLTIPEITGLAISEDGRNVWVGGWYGGLLRSSDHGLTFDPLDAELRVRCLAYRPGELWVCTDDVMGDYALGRSTDLGETVVPIWAFVDATPDVGCGVCTQVGGLCPAYWPDVEFDLGLLSSGMMDARPPDPDASIAPSCIDAGPMDAAAFDGGIDAGTSTPVTPASCGCRAGGRGAPSSVALIVLAAALASNARRRQRNQRV